MTMSLSAPSRRVAFAAFVTLLALVGLMSATTAGASSAASTTAKGCAQQVVNDWYTHADKKVHGHYPLHCYQEALDSIGSDVGDYTNAREAIAAAAAAEALRCKPDCGPTDSSGTHTLKPGEKWIEYRNTYDFGGQSPPNADAVPVSNSSPSSVPLPLIILAALAVILVLAGAGSYLARRLKANRQAPPAADASS
jgi:hypothetical protein